MLIDFRFENFRSYHREARLQLARNGEVNRVAAIYGPNASGKTNVVNALAMMRGMVLGSSSLNSTDVIGFQPFVFAVKDEKSEGLFEVTFSTDEGVWRYGFSFDDNLYSYSHNQLSARGRYAQRMLELLKFADPTVAAVRKVPAELETGLGREADERLRHYAKANGLRAEKIELVRRAADAQVLVPLPFDEFESAGTQKMFCLSGPLTDILEHGYTLVVDEVDSKFHPSLTQKIFSMFADASTNPHRAQLIVTTHDVELMRSGMLRPQQIFFSEKNLRGESSLYSLADFRNSEQYRAPEIADRYLQGIFGSIPSFEEDVHESRVD